MIEETENVHRKQPFLEGIILSLWPLRLCTPQIAAQLFETQ